VPGPRHTAQIGDERPESRNGIQNAIVHRVLRQGFESAAVSATDFRFDSAVFSSGLKNAFGGFP
jgi:hypothetical protein